MNELVEFSIENGNNVILHVMLFNVHRVEYREPVIIYNNNSEPENALHGELTIYNSPLCCLL